MIALAVSSAVVTVWPVALGARFVSLTVQLKVSVASTAAPSRTVTLTL